MFDLHLGSQREVCADVGRWERLCEFAVVSSAFQGALWKAFHQKKWPIANLYASECVCVCVHLNVGMIAELFCAKPWSCVMLFLWKHLIGLQQWKMTPFLLHGLKWHGTDVVKNISWTGYMCTQCTGLLSAHPENPQWADQQNPVWAPRWAHYYIIRKSSQLCGHLWCQSEERGIHLENRKGEDICYVCIVFSVASTVSDPKASLSLLLVSVVVLACLASRLAGVEFAL